MSEGLFSPDDLLTMQTEGEMATSLPPIPEQEYPAMVVKLDPRSGVSGKTGEPYNILDVTWEIDDEEVREIVGIPNPTARQSIFLDVNDQGLELGPGKNIQLGRLREAVGQNGPGVWSMSDLEGASAVVRIEQRMFDGNTYSDVKGVRAA